MSVQRFVSVSVVAGMLLGASMASAQATKAAAKPDPDEAAMHDYILTVEKAQRYMDVAGKAQAAAQKDAALGAEMQKVQAADVTNVDKAALMEKSPHVAAFLKSVNFTARDFVLLPLTVQMAEFAASQPNNGGAKLSFVNPVNIQFVKQHKDELKTWGLE